MTEAQPMIALGIVLAVLGLLIELGAWIGTR